LQFHPFAWHFKVVNTVERFEQLLLCLCPDLDLSETFQHAIKHQLQNAPSTIITSPSIIIAAFCQVTPSPGLQFFSTYLYSVVERTMAKVQGPAQEQNAMSVTILTKTL